MKVRNSAVTYERLLHFQDNEPKNLVQHGVSVIV